jgi:hypothetical protein
MSLVIPAQAGIQLSAGDEKRLDPGLRRDDDVSHSKPFAKIVSFAGAVSS